MLKTGTEYAEIGQDYYEQKYQTRIIKNLTNSAKSLGYELIKAQSEEMALFRSILRNFLICITIKVTAPCPYTIHQFKNYSIAQLINLS
jgi:hypothetical protein